RRRGDRRAAARGRGARVTGPSAPDAGAEVAQLREAHDELLARMHAAGAADWMDDEERARLKEEIATLFRAVDRRLAALAVLKEDVKALVAAWKQLPPAPPPPPASPEPAFLAGEAEPEPVPAMRARAPVADHASVRVDHLGASTFVAKGWSAISMGDHARGEEALSRALALAPEDPEAEALLAWALMGQGRLDAAAAACERVLARAPHFLLAQVNLGWIALRRGDHARALELLAPATRDETDRKAALYATFYVGLVYLHRGMYADAVAYFRQALALGPNLLEAYYETGRALWLAGDRDAAVQAWRAGAASGKFNAWGARCAEVLEQVGQGGGPPPLE
ncbi:tetratricopeptide repeat protein, partial [Roseisolibacter sp. H3M3-2]|uniref:tetratricopeptide repeat protein n=1 Tax=Roseisolibacter sp. H3M3-2 TaxID=3031323 RepID=UPI0023DB62BB